MNDPVERPLGLALLTWLLWFWAGACVLVIAVLLVGDGPIPLSGRAVPRGEAVARMVPILGPIALAAAGAALALGLRRHWARAAVLLPFALAAVTPAFTGVAVSVADLARGALALTPIVAILVWYLFFRPEVAGYFAALRQVEERSSR